MVGRPDQSFQRERAAATVRDSLKTQVASKKVSWNQSLSGRSVKVHHIGCFEFSRPCVTTRVVPMWLCKVRNAFECLCMRRLSPLTMCSNLCQSFVENHHDNLCQILWRSFFPPDCTSPTQFDHWWLSSVHELLCLLIWSIAIEHLHHESVCDQSQLNASMRVCVINRNWTPPWIACWPINQLINWSTSTPWLADHLINWSTSTPWLADQLINWLRLTWSTSSTSTSWINFDSLICLLTN